MTPLPPVPLEADRPDGMLPPRGKPAEPPTIDELRLKYLSVRASHGWPAWKEEPWDALHQQLLKKVEHRESYVFSGARAISTLWELERVIDAGYRNLLILGERGSGKGAAARVVAMKHGTGRVAVNCATLTDTIADALLFGVAAGAGIAGVDEGGTEGFVGQAGKGVLFLDEFFEAPAVVMPKLLRLLGDHEYYRVGESAADPRKFEGLIVAASNRYATRDHLKAGVLAEEVRADLVDRFELQVEIPPLCDRRDEIEFLVPALQREGDEAFNGTTLGALQAHEYEWPGNLRELRNFVREQAWLRSQLPENERYVEKQGPGIHIPHEDIHRLLPAAGQQHRDTSAEGPPPRLPAWSTQWLGDARKRQLMAYLQLEMAQEDQLEVSNRWVARKAREALGVSASYNLSQRLREAVGASCAELAAELNGTGQPPQPGSENAR